MLLETLHAQTITEREIIEKNPLLENIRATFISTLEKMKVEDQEIINNLNKEELAEVEANLRGERGVSRPSHAIIWLTLLSKIEKTQPHLAFWRGDSEQYMNSAESGQFSLGNPKYCIEWSKKHDSKLIGKFSISKLKQLYDDGLIWISQMENINSGIGWYIGTKQDKEILSQYMDLYELV
jgi:hypothetical protein